MGFESRKQTSRAGNLRLLAGCAAQWFKGGGGFRVALTGRCMSGRSHQGRGFGSARALPGAHRRRWPPHAPCGRDCAIMRRLIGSFHRNKTNFSGGDGPIYSSHSGTARSARPRPGGAEVHSEPPRVNQHAGSQLIQVGSLVALKSTYMKAYLSEKKHP